MSALPLDAEIAELLESRAVDAMRTGQEYDPLDPVNFGEALTEASENQLAIVANHLRSGDFVAVSAALTAITTAYWLDYAKTLLETSVLEEVERRTMAKTFPNFLQYQAH